jgi:hypothetical protein
MKHTIWEMKNGIALIEVESVAEGHEQAGVWESYTEHPGFSGKTAYRMASSGNEYMDPLAHDAEKANEPYKLTYRVYVPEAGEYEVRIHNFHWLKDGDNDAWIGINDDLYEKIWDHNTLVWSWNEAIAWQFSYQPRWLHKGVNTISIVGRSENWVIDRLAVVKKGIPDESWQNINLPESNKLIRNGQPEKPVNMKVLKTGSTFAIIDWEESPNAVAYLIYVNDHYLKTTYKTQTVIGNLKKDQENILQVRAENSLGETSEPQQLSISTIPENLVQVTKTSKSINWESIRNISTSEEAELKVALQDSAIILKLSFNNQEGFINVSFDPDNSKSETFSMADRLYYSKIGSQEIKERLDRDANVKDIILLANLVGDNTIEMLLICPYSTLGEAFNEGDLFGLKVWISEGGKGEKSKVLILGDENYPEINFPYTFTELIVSEK